MTCKDDRYRHIGVRYFVHNAGLADDGEFENEIREDPKIGRAHV